MIIRRNICPRRLSDAAITLFTICIIPVVYYFELFIVLPRFMPMWSGHYLFHFITGTFILFNVCSNLVAIIVCDTSIRGRLMPTQMGPNTRFCTVCECIAPARSYHCEICNICILKRDHHCIFTSCCIGHDNIRYFITFIFYMFIATVYASFYNVFFVYEFVEVGTLESIIKLIFPLATLFVSYSTNQMYLFLVAIIMIGGCFTGVLLWYHGELILKGMITHEKNHKLSMYDLGKRQNIRLALGEKWHLAWLSPFIVSNLPHDGVYWDMKQSLKAK